MPIIIIFQLMNYAINCELLRKEWENLKQKTYSDLEWAKENIEFVYRIDINIILILQLENWQALKEKNIKRFRKKETKWK